MQAEAPDEVSLDQLRALARTPIYPGLRPFAAHEHHLFFGREAQVRQIADKLGREGFVAVLGGSGSGKSSIVRAGLEPFLRTEGIGRVGDSWRVVTFTPGVRPLASLVRGLSEIVRGGTGETDRIAGLLQSEGSLEAFRRTFCQDFLLAQGAQAEAGSLPSVAQNERANLLVVIDQFEEIFRKDTDDDEAAQLVELVLEARRNRHLYERLFVILTMRSDDLHGCATFLELPDAINASSFLVRRLNRDELMQAIYAPARNIMLEDALADAATMRGDRFAPFDAAVIRVLLDATLAMANDPDHLPLLQHLIAATWAHATGRWIEAAQAAGGRLDAAGLRVTGEDLAACCGVGASALNDLKVRRELLRRGLETSAEARFTGLSSRGREIARAALTRLAHIDDQGLIKREFARADQLAAVAHTDAGTLASTLDAFRNPWPFIRQLGHVGGDAFDVSHESFIRKWPRFRRWLREEREALDGFDRLERSLERKPRSGLAARLKGWLLAPDLSHSQFQHAGRLNDPRYDFAWLHGHRPEIDKARFAAIKGELRLAGQWWRGRVYWRNLALIALLAAGASWALSSYRNTVQLDRKNDQLLVQQAALRQTQELLLSLLDVSTWQNAASANLLGLSSLPTGKQLAVLEELFHLNERLDGFYADLGALVQGLAGDAQGAAMLERSGRFALQLRQLEKQTDRTIRHALGSLAFKSDTGPTGFGRAPTFAEQLVASASLVRQCLQASRAGARLSVIDAAIMPEQDETFIVLLRNADNAAELRVLDASGDGPGCREDGGPVLLRTSGLAAASLSRDGSILLEMVPASADTPFEGYRLTRLEWVRTCAEPPPGGGACAAGRQGWDVLAQEIGVVPFEVAQLSGPGTPEKLSRDDFVLADEPVRVEILPPSQAAALAARMASWPPGPIAIEARKAENGGAYLVAGERRVSGSPNPQIVIKGFDSAADPRGDLVAFVASTRIERRTRAGTAPGEACAGGETCRHFVRIVRLGDMGDGLAGNELNILEVDFVAPAIAGLRLGQGEADAGSLILQFAATGEIGRLRFGREPHRAALAAGIEALRSRTDAPADLCPFHSASFRMLDSDCAR